MQESLKSSRTAHTILLMVATITIAFALSLESPEWSSQALVELDVLESMDVQAMLSKAACNAFLADDRATALILRLEEQLRTAVEDAGLSIRHRWDLVHVEKADEPDKVRDFYRLLAGKRQHSVPEISLTDHHLDSFVAIAKQKAIKEFIYEHEANEFRLLDVDSDEVLLSVQGVERHSFWYTPIEVLRQYYPFNLLSGKDQRALPGLHMRWDELRFKTLHDAFEDVVELRKTEGKQSLAILGIQVDIRIAVLAVPLVIIAVSVHFYLLLSHLIRRWSSIRESAETFPWFVLFPGDLADLATTGTIFIVPVVSIWLLVQRTWGANTMPVVTMSIAMAATYALRRVSRRAHELREKWETT